MVIDDKGGEKQRYEWYGSIWHMGRDITKERDSDRGVFDIGGEI